MSLISYSKAAELMEPGDGAFDHPALGAQAAAMRGAAFGQEGLNAFGFKARAESGAVIRAVGIQAKDFATQAIRQRGEQGEKIAAVMPVGRRQACDQRHAVGVSQDVVLAARFGPVNRIWPRLAPPKTALTLLESTATLDQLILPAPSSFSSNTRCSRSHTPAASQPRIRRQHVMPLPQPSSWGKSSHPMPVFRMNIMPVSASRSPIGLRPGLRLRRAFGAGSNGLIISHSSSLKSGLAILVFHTFSASLSIHFVRRSKSKWVSTSYIIPPDSGESNLAWLSLNFRLNYKASQWSVSINDKTVAAGLSLENSTNERGRLILSAGPEGDAHVESIRTEALEFEQVLLAGSRLLNYVTCVSCGGSGKKGCPEGTCSGGEKDCSVCGGDGRSRLACTSCNGFGFQWEQCLNCEASSTGEQDPNCDCNEGYYMDFCKACDGYAWVDDDCQSCRDSSGRSTGKEKCSTCGGSGLVNCTPCDGSGQVPE